MAERTGILTGGDFSRVADSIEVLLRVVDDKLEFAWRQARNSTWTAVLVPAWALLGEDASIDPVWGAHAQAWLSRGRSPIALFPLGYPGEPGVVREFLKQLVVHHLKSSRSPRVVVGLSTSSDLEREVWQEVFDEGGWQLCGFLAEPLYLRTLHREVLQAISGPGDFSKILVLELRLNELRWLALEGDEVKVEGGEPSLGSRTLVRDLQHRLRHAHSLEVSELVATALLFSERRTAESQVAGRQLHSGLPTKVDFDMKQYWLLASKARSRWNELQAQIAFKILGRVEADPWRQLSDHGWQLAIDRTLPHWAREQNAGDLGLVR